MTGNPTNLKIAALQKNSSLSQILTFTNLSPTTPTTPPFKPPHTMIRTPAPKNARSARAAAASAPKLVENAKTALHLHSTSSSALLQDVLTNLHALKKPFSKKFTKKNPNVHPFEDASSLEFFSQKNDAAFVLIASHSKKRPHNLVLARCFEHKLLDMVEFGIDPETWKGMEGFAGEKARVGVKPMLLFSGDAWERDEGLKLVRSLWLDYFRGEMVDRVDVEGLQYVISFAAVQEEGGKQTVNVRAHMIRTLRSGEKLPRVEVSEMGPRMDLTVRRVKEAEPELLREALRRPKAGVVSAIICRGMGCGLIGIADENEEERRDGHHGRQARPHPHGQAGSGQAADPQDEGAQGGQAGSRRRRRGGGRYIGWGFRGRAGGGAGSREEEQEGVEAFCVMILMLFFSSFAAVRYNRDDIRII